MLDMRVRIRELMAGDKSPARTATQLSKYLAKRGFSPRTAFRIVNVNGKVERMDLRLADALCEIFGVGPDELFEYKPKRPRAA